ncbi:hypothetical protein JBL43_11245 [Aureibaculum sp. A20]|uniref:Uncharacterized protein n=1 Tax=Aureibaculum flavum TaxID=2795986 RepID=A0ABS0WS60_9FLAO|nr:hypothetical protein [Aureibaculum flavum]MBJ2174815.1 hypothetical protein [Aureibaculum flavum]
MKNKRKAIYLLITLLTINLGFYLWTNSIHNKTKKYDNYDFEIGRFFEQSFGNQVDSLEMDAKMKSVEPTLRWFAAIDFYASNSEKDVRVQQVKAKYSAIKTKSDAVSFSEAFYTNLNQLKEQYFQSYSYKLREYKWYALTPLYAIGLLFLFKHTK